MPVSLAARRAHLDNTAMRAGPPNHRPLLVIATLIISMWASLAPASAQVLVEPHRAGKTRVSWYDFDWQVLDVTITAAGVHWPSPAPTQSYEVTDTEPPP